MIREGHLTSYRHLVRVSTKWHDFHVSLEYYYVASLTPAAQRLALNLIWLLRSGSVYAAFSSMIPFSPQEKLHRHIVGLLLNTELCFLHSTFRLLNWFANMALNNEGLEAAPPSEEQVGGNSASCKQPLRTVFMVNDLCNQMPNGAHTAGIEINRQHSMPSPLSNPRKRPRSDEPAIYPATTQLSESGDPEDQSSRYPKRSRGTEKLDKNETVQGQRRSTRQRMPKTTSPRQTYHSDQTPRQSKFLEGSMNDKASQKPPSMYTGEDEAMEEYMAGPSTSQPSAIRPSQETNTFYDAGIEQEKPSTMYRFGRALANVFNPVSVWTGRWKSKEPQIDPQQTILQERQAKAQRVYAELKRSGFKGTQGATTTLMAGHVPSMQYDVAPPSSQTTSFWDSAIDVEDYPLSVENKEDKQMNDPDGGIMPAPSVPLVPRSVSPMPSASGRRSSLNLRTPTLSAIKRVSSHLQLPSAKRHSAQESILSVTDSVDSGTYGQQIKKQPSKKDLLKQQKLYKKVSNLETKLEVARRELEAAQGITPEATVLPTTVRPKAFTPGALPSLPSERILKDHIRESSARDSEADILSSTEELPRIKLKGRYSMDRRLEFPSIPVLFPNLPSSSRKRKSTQRIEDILNPSVSESKDNIEPLADTESASKRPRRTPKIEKTMIGPRPLPLTQPEQESFVQGPQKTSSWKSQAATAPPVPELPPQFHPSQVDKAKIMLMRDSADYHLPFGQSAMDAINLRKVYPMITDAQMEGLLGKRQQDNKTIDITSTTHLNHTATPTLSPPRSASPAKGGFSPLISRASLRSRTQKVPNNSPISVRKTAQEEFEEIASQAAQETSKEEEKDTVAPLSHSVAKGLPPYPKDPAMTVQSPVKDDKRTTAIDKPLPGTQKEDFEWDEDVF